MRSTIRRSRSRGLAAVLLLLALPAPGLAADEVDWGFRQGFRSYVYGGNGAPPITAVTGASCDPNPDPARGGCDPKLGATTEVFGWTAVDASYALPSGAGTIDLGGSVTFTRPDHFFTMSLVDPVVTVDADGGAIVNVRMTVISDLPQVPDQDERIDLGEFELTSRVEVTATTATWELGNGAVTSEAAAALGSFLTAGAPLDPLRIVLPLDEFPAATSTPTPGPTTTPTPAPTATPGAGRVCGDADGNGRVTVSDGVNVLRAGAGLAGACSDPAPCDVDGNGVVTVTDGVNVLRAAAGLTVTPRCFDLE